MLYTCMYRIARFASFPVLAVHVAIHSSVFLFLFLFRCVHLILLLLLFLLKFCLHSFSSYGCDAFLLAYKKPYGFDLPLSIFFSCFNLRYQHYIISPFCQHSWCALHLVHAIFLTVISGIWYTSLFNAALWSDSLIQWLLLFFPPPKSFFQVYYHSIANVMYTWVVSSRCWCTFFYMPVWVSVSTLYIERECTANVM